MVCLDIADRITNSDVGLYLRPSMNKFVSQNRSIDVVRVSSMPSASFLSRQIILLLSSLGIADDVFRSMQNEMLCDLKTLTTDHKKAREFLHKFGGIGGNGYHAFLLNYLKTFRGHMEPFAHKLLVAFQGYLLKELRTKARILVPNTWTVLGVIDETRTLKYGQVFVQIHEKTESGGIKPKMITGPVIVTRSPCFHPGK
jgi:RNA-dependent RNA polymerase